MPTSANESRLDDELKSGAPGLEEGGIFWGIEVEEGIPSSRPGGGEKRIFSLLGHLTLILIIVLHLLMYIFFLHMLPVSPLPYLFLFQQILGVRKGLEPRDWVSSATPETFSWFSGVLAPESYHLTIAEDRSCQALGRDGCGSCWLMAGTLVDL